MRINTSMIIVLLMLLFLLSCGSEPTNKPDIILIIPDALRAKQLPCYGYNKIKTPNIDSIVQEGVLFKNCFVKIPGTLSSFSNIFSGLLFPSDGLVNGEKRLAQYLKENGYTTLGVVSSRVLWSEEHSEKSGLVTHFNRGFDRYYQDATLEKSPYHRKNKATTEDVLELLEKYKKSKNPLFLFVHYMDPHAPYNPSYDKEIKKIDVEVGRILAKLKKINRYEHSLVVFMSDHGESTGNVKEDHGSPGGHGWYLYDEHVRVPLILKFPDRKYTGAVEQVVRVYDILPTILDYSGIHYEKNKLDGLSLLPAIRNGRDMNLISYSVGSPTRILPEGSQSVTFTHNVNMYVFIKGKFSSQVRELYNLTLDPKQENNLAANKKYKPLLKKAKKLLLDFIKIRRTKLVATAHKPKLPNKKDTKVLRTLGYINAGAPSITTKIGHVLMKKDLSGIGRIKYSGIIRHPAWGHYPGSDIWPNLNDRWFPIKMVNDGEYGFYITGNQDKELFHYHSGLGFQSLNVKNVSDIALDIKNHRLLFLQNNHLNSLPWQGSNTILIKKWQNTALGVYVDASGHIYVMEKEKIIKIDSRGKFLKEFNFAPSSPRLFTVDGSGHLILGKKNVIFKYDQKGNQLVSFSAFKEAHFITAFAIDDKNRIWVTPEHSTLIKIFNPDGDTITMFKYNFKEDRYRKWKPIPIKQLHFLKDTLYVMDNLEGILAYSISTEHKR